MNSKTAKQYKRARTTSLVLLFFLGLSALPPGVLMILDPSGVNMGLPPEMLDQSPFENFRVPGVLLGFFNGILSLLIAILVIRRHRFQAWMIMFQGGILAGWLSAEVLMGLFYPILTIPYYLVAILMLICGRQMKLYGTGLI